MAPRDDQADTRKMSEVGYLLGQPDLTMEMCGPASGDADCNDPYNDTDSDERAGPGPGMGMSQRMS